MNGRPGDHPLTDILVHKLQVYGPEADNLIRQLHSSAADENWTRGGSVRSGGLQNALSSLIKLGRV
jgi:hypothetical protein